MLRPSMGKTALALTLARNAAVDHDIPVGIFSLEMSTMQLIIRLLCAEGKLNVQIKNGDRFLSAVMWPKTEVMIVAFVDSILSGEWV